MARSAVRRSSMGAAIRAALIANAEDFYGSFPSGPKLERIAALKAAGDIVMDSAALFRAVYRVSPEASEPYTWRYDRDNTRRYLLDRHDRLTEIR